MSSTFSTVTPCLMSRIPHDEVRTRTTADSPPIPVRLELRPETASAESI
jgi:hypothetical protein